MSWKKNVKAFLLAPLPVSTIAVIRALYLNNPISWEAIFIVITGSIYVSLLMVGIPTYLLLGRLKLSGMLIYLACGALLAPIALVLLSLWNWTANNYTLGMLAGPSLLASFAGLVTSASFWFVARPDQTD
jgi:uncharacterized membrane protein